MREIQDLESGNEAEFIYPKSCQPNMVAVRQWSDRELGQMQWLDRLLRSHHSSYSWSNFGSQMDTTQTSQETTAFPPTPVLQTEVLRTCFSNPLTPPSDLHSLSFFHIKGRCNSSIKPLIPVMLKGALFLTKAKLLHLSKFSTSYLCQLKNHFLWDGIHNSWARFSLIFTCL